MCLCVRAHRRPASPSASVRARATTVRRYRGHRGHRTAQPPTARISISSPRTDIIINYDKGAWHIATRTHSNPPDQRDARLTQGIACSRPRGRIDLQNTEKSLRCQRIATMMGERVSEEGFGWVWGVVGDVGVKMLRMNALELRTRTRSSHTKWPQ